jgi:hypothetical protein
LGRFFINNSRKANFSFLASRAEFFSGNCIIWAMDDWSRLTCSEVIRLNI